MLGGILGRTLGEKLARLLPRSQVLGKGRRAPGIHVARAVPLHSTY